MAKGLVCELIYRHRNCHLFQYIFGYGNYRSLDPETKGKYFGQEISKYPKTRKNEDEEFLLFTTKKTRKKSGKGGGRNKEFCPKYLPRQRHDSYVIRPL